MAVIVPTYEKGKLYQVSMSLLTPDPEQPRKFFDEQALAELQASIVSHGVPRRQSPGSTNRNRI